VRREVSHSEGQNAGHDIEHDFSMRSDITKTLSSPEGPGPHHPIWRGAFTVQGLEWQFSHAAVNAGCGCAAGDVDAGGRPGHVTGSVGLPGAGMTRLFLTGAAALWLAGIDARAAVAGGMADPVMDQAVVVEDTASSGGDNWVGILMLILVAAAVASD
jgi:hypothetical protein